MINRHTDRADIYFISMYTWGSDSKHHFMNHMFSQNGSVTTIYEKKHTVGGFAVCRSRHTCSLSLCS